MEYVDSFKNSFVRKDCPTVNTMDSSGGTSSTKEAFNHIMDNVLDCPNVKRALISEGYEDLFSMMSFDDDIIDNLKYPDVDLLVPTNHYLKKGEIGLLKSFIHFIYYREELGSPIGNSWTSITMDEFDEFRTNFDYASSLSTLTGLTKYLSSGPASSPPSCNPHNPSDPPESTTCPSTPQLSSNPTNLKEPTCNTEVN